jgi:hypothetical protein
MEIIKLQILILKVWEFLLSLNLPVMIFMKAREKKRMLVELK